MGTRQQSFHLAEGAEFILGITLEIGIVGESLFVGILFFGGFTFLFLTLLFSRRSDRGSGRTGGRGGGGSDGSLSVEETLMMAGVVAGGYGTVFYLSPNDDVNRLER